jgi:hypothetical protein
MSNSSFFGYSYFSGANCFVKLNGMPALEMAGISYQVQESTQPIYGYSSRIFDAVAMGQKIVRGNFVINFVSPNYIARMIDVSRSKVNAEAIATRYNKYSNEEMDGLVSSNKNTELLALEKKFLNDSYRDYKIYEIERTAEMKGFNEVAAEARRLIDGSYDSTKTYRVLEELQNAAYDDKINDIVAKYSDRGSRYNALEYADAEIGKGLSGGTINNPMYNELEERLLKGTGGDTQGVVDAFLKEKRTEIAGRYQEDNLNQRYNEVAAAEIAFFKELDSLKAEMDYERRVRASEGMRSDQATGNAIAAAYDIAESNIEYDITVETSEDFIEIYQNKLKTYRESLENENKTIVEKELETRREYERIVNKLKAAKSVNSKKAIEADLKALEVATNSYYTNSEQASLVGMSRINDIGLLGPFNIDIQFAEEYTITIVDAFLTTRGSMIQIDENAIVEEYSFFARDIIYN